MRVLFEGRTILDARGNAEPIEDVVTSDYYAQLPQLRVFRDPSDQRARASKEPDVILDGTDVLRVVECAIRHPNPNMRNGIASAIWNDAAMFQRIFEFGLDAPEAFAEIRSIVAEALAKRGAASEASTAGGDKPLLPRMPLPAHLRDRARKKT